MHEIDRFVGAVGAGRGAADQHGGMIEPDQAVGDRIDQAALLAHFLIEARVRRAAAENVIDEIGGHEIGILARDAGTAEIDHRLRHVERDIDAAAEPLRRGVLDRHQIRLFRQRAEHAIEERLQGLGVDVADDGDFQIRPRQHLMRIGFEIVDGDGLQRFLRAVDRPAIGMALERGLPPALAGDIARARRLPPQDRQQLGAIDLDIGRRRNAARSKPAAADRRPRRDFPSSVRSAPRTLSRSALKLISMALRSRRSANALESRSPAPSSSRDATKLAVPALPGGS